MQDYDVVLKLLLRGSAKLLLADLAGTTVARWLNVELPELVNRRVDLLGETDDGTLIQIDLQSGHDKTMALRMAEYALAIYRLFGKFPRQVVLYVGELPLKMDDTLAGPGKCQRRFARRAAHKHAGARAILGDELRLAQGRDETECTAAVHHPD